MSKPVNQPMPNISFKPTGSFKVHELKTFEDSDGNPIQTKQRMSLCRCGASKIKPFCDNTHREIGFTGELISDGEWDKRDTYVGKGITIHDNRGICAHSGKCTDNLPSVWRMKTEPWIDPDGATVEEIIKVVKMCPSGALSYSIDNEEHRDQDREPCIRVTDKGPYYVTGGVIMENQPRHEKVSIEHYTLCRCGGSKNKPFCDGSHWYNGFDDDGKVKINKKDDNVIIDDKIEGFVEVASDGDLKDGELKLVDVDGQQLMIFKNDGAIGAVSPSCTHQGGPLDEGDIVDGKVVCPWHGHHFDLKDGRSTMSSLPDIPIYEVKISSGKVFVSVDPKVPMADATESSSESPVKEESGEYLSKWSRTDDDFETKFGRIQRLAKGEKSDISPMRTQKTFPDWDTILFKGSQLFRLPVNEEEAVSLKTVIGKSAEHPLEIDLPFYVSHMSFGALSAEAKTALAKGASAVGTASCSGEGGMLPAERENAKKYIYEIGTGGFSNRDELLRQADAVEIKIGQAAKPGMGGHLPGEKVTAEIAKVRGIKQGVDSISPGRYTYINNRTDLKNEVSRIRKVIGGKPIGIKLAAGHIERDIEFAAYAEPDFITIDCRGGATGAALTFVKDNVCIPPIFAIRRARIKLDQLNPDRHITLCVTGGFRDSVEITKALALGADAVALATASLIAIGCQQYRICHTGNCPVGITTQDPKLRSRFDIDASTERFINFYNATAGEIKTLAQINGRRNVHDFDLSDVMTLSNEISMNTDIEHV